MDLFGTTDARVFHMTRFEAASMPEDGSSSKRTVGLPHVKSAGEDSLEGCRAPTQKRNGKAELPLIATGQLACKSGGDALQPYGPDNLPHVVLDIGNASDTGVEPEVLERRHLVHRVELGTDAHVRSCRRSLRSDGRVLDEDLALAIVGLYVAPDPGETNNQISGRASRVRTEVPFDDGRRTSRRLSTCRPRWDQAAQTLLREKRQR